ncbi:MAG: hypothetical protein MJZ82_00370 [Paludibacteraceae bacterium]|nr:hypothetical protein [Paludibacteraceae bacterium]
MSLFANRKHAHTRERGYLSFTEKQILQQADEAGDNRLPYQLLLEAMSTSSDLSEEVTSGDTVDVDDIYPCTAVECDQMERLLQQSEAAAQNKVTDLRYWNQLRELKEVVRWSRARHFTFRWPILAAGFLSIFLFHSGSHIGLYILLVLLFSALYVLSSLQLGYCITRSRAEFRVLDGWQKIGYTLASFFFGRKVADTLFPDWLVSAVLVASRNESDRRHMLRQLLQAVLAVVGFFLACYLSLVLMAVLTVRTFLRNRRYAASV